MKKIQPLHPIAAVLAQQPDAFKNLVNHPDVISYLFHTPLEKITHGLPAEDCTISLIDYLNKPKQSEQKKEFIQVLVDQLKEVKKYKQASQQYTFMALLYYQR